MNGFFKSLNWYDLMLMGGIIAVTVIYSIAAHELDPLAMTASICGVVNVVLCAKGSIYNYPFGIIYNALFAYIYFKSRTYGLALEFALYFLPMQFVGWVNWTRHRQSGDDSLVKARRMSGKQILTTVCITVAAIAGGYFILKAVGGENPLLDAPTTVLNIVAMVLMVKAFTEQWFIWTLVDVLTLVLWIVKACNGVEHSGIMIISAAFFVINCIGGWVQWKRSEKASETVEKV